MGIMRRPDWTDPKTAVIVALANTSFEAPL